VKNIALPFPYTLAYQANNVIKIRSNTMNKKTKQELDVIRSTITGTLVSNGETYFTLKHDVLQELETIANKFYTHAPQCIFLITDGGCTNNGKENATGTWSAMLIRTTQNEESTPRIICKLYSGTVENPTNNRAELTAIHEGTCKLNKRVHKLIIVSDSKYATDALSGKTKIKKNGPLINSTKRTLASKAELIMFERVKGHDGHPLNELVDALASNQLSIADFGIKGGE